MSDELCFKMVVMMIVVLMTLGIDQKKKRNETERYLPMYPLKWPMINN